MRVQRRAYRVAMAGSHYDEGVTARQRTDDLGNAPKRIRGRRRALQASQAVGELEVTIGRHTDTTGEMFEGEVVDQAQVIGLRRPAGADLPLRPAQLSEQAVE